MEGVTVLGAAAGWGVRGFMRAQGASWPDWVVVTGPAVLWGVLTSIFGIQAHLLPAAGMALCLWVACCVDLRTHRIPNVIVLATFGLGLLAQSLRVGLVPALPALAAACAAGLLFSVAVIGSRGGFGWGDAKLAAAMGCILGPGGMAVALLVTSLTAGVVAAVALLFRWRNWRDPLPFAPFFLVGGMVALFAAAHP